MKHKKKLLLLFIVLLINAAGIFLLLPGSSFNVKNIYIAVAGPMSGVNKENGESMLRGINMYLDTIKDRSGFKDKKIQLLIYNDKDKRSALTISSQIADEGKALVVLGHYGSEETVAAGTIYRKKGIPAITASATSETVTQDNDWYFRMVPDNRFIKSFMAYGIRNILGSTSASIIYSKNDYGISLARGFETESEKLGINIRNKWAFQRESENMYHELRNIIGDLRAAKNLGTIMCATHGAAGVRLFASCRYPGTDYTVVGPDSFSTPAFVSQFNNYPREQNSPGYYTDGIYAVSPFVSYLADGENARSFRQKFVSRYGKEPSWVAACYYDAMQVVLSAIEKAEIQGQDIREDRRRVRKALTSFNEHDVAVKGVTGDIFFDKEGNVNRPLAMGFWNRHTFLPTYSQYQGGRWNRNSDKNSRAGRKGTAWQIKENKETEEASIQIQGQAMAYLRVVYAGIDINRISNIDIKKGTFGADFYISFRFEGHFDDTRIRFTNALNPVALKAPVTTKTVGNITTRSYRVTADFKTVYDTNAYPLDRQLLGISFRHEDHTRDELIYVPDVAGLPRSAEKKDKSKMMLNPIPGWDIGDISFSQDIIKIFGPDKQSSSYSRLNTDIRIDRQGRLFLLLKILFPLIMVVIFLYFVFLLPFDLPGVRMLMLIPIVLIISGIRLLYAYILPGQESVRDVFFAIYVLTALSVLISGGGHIMYKCNSAEKVKFLSGIGKILYLFIVLTGAGFLLYSYRSLIYF